MIGGFWVARMSWRRVAQAWDDALSGAREKGIAA
jgi:branched-chain amino acid transport system permease protein